MGERIDLSKKFNVEHFHLNNHNLPVADITVTLVSVKGHPIEAEYEIKLPFDDLDEYVGEFATREQALLAAEQAVWHRLKNYK